MNAICVDDEAQVLNHVVSSCQKLRLLDEVKGFTDAQDALEWLDGHPADLALLDIDMPGMNGLELAGRIRKIHPGISIIFITAFSQYALGGRTARKPAHITMQTFGHFEILVDGTALAFRRSKSKELLAYLVDRRGAGVTRQDAFAALWEDRPYDVSMQKQMDVVIRSLRDTLQKYGIGDVFELKSRNLRVRMEMIDCDLYRFLEGDEEAVNAYFGEYMSQYTWASNTEAQLAQLKKLKR